MTQNNGHGNLIDRFLSRDEPSRLAVVAPTHWGKTTCLTNLIRRFLKYHADYPVFLNYTILKGPILGSCKPIHNFRETKDLSYCLFAIDELNKYAGANSYNWGSNSNRVYTEMASNLRKQDVSFLWSAQRGATVDLNIRNNVEMWIVPRLDIRNRRPVIDLTFYESWENLITGKALTYGKPLRESDKIMLYEVGHLPEYQIKQLEERLLIPYQETINPRDDWGTFNSKQIIPFYKEKRDPKAELAAFKTWATGEKIDLKGLTSPRVKEILALYNVTVETTTGWPLTGQDKEALIALSRLEGLL